MSRDILERDIAGEARDWRESTVSVARNFDLTRLLEAPISEEKLIEAYRAWWAEYTLRVSNSPSTRSWEGISQRDARAAGAGADELVVELLSPQG